MDSKSASQVKYEREREKKKVKKLKQRFLRERESDIEGIIIDG